MADFCKQCAIEMCFPTTDLANLGGGHRQLQSGEAWLALCEGCGPTLVDDAGKCLGACLRPEHDYNEDQITDARST